MKKSIILLLSAALMAFAFTGCLPEADEDGSDTAENAVQVQAAITDIKEQTVTISDFGARGALTSEEFTLEEMLIYAMQDEYLARQEYESIMEKYGEQRPFSNIIIAEENHITWLKELYEKYGFEIPEDTAIDYVAVPDSLDAAFDLGVQAEIDNIAMYEIFLEQELPEDIKDIFIELRDASKNHLAAFEKGPRGGGNRG